MVTNALGGVLIFELDTPGSLAAVFTELHGLWRSLGFRITIGSWVYTLGIDTVVYTDRRKGRQCII